MPAAVKRRRKYRYLDGETAALAQLPQLESHTSTRMANLSGAFLPRASVERT